MATEAAGKPRILVGTSGYSYDDWVGPFYPEGTTHARISSPCIRASSPLSS